MSSLMTRLLSSSSTSSRSSRSSRASKPVSPTTPSTPASELNSHGRTKSDASITSTFSFRRHSTREPVKATSTVTQLPGQQRQSMLLPSPPPSPAQEQKDALPNDAGPLDGLLNYHLGQLGRLKQEVATYNATIEQLDYTYRDMIGYPTATHTAQMLWARIQAERAARDSLFSFAMFHVEEIERIVRHKACLAGAPELVTNIYKQIPTYHEWNELFSC